MFDTLPDVLTASILSFCEHKDMLKIATFNRQCLDIIEAYCLEQLNKIRNSHQVDFFWDHRLAEQASRANNGQLMARYSNRHLLKCARQVHLYSLGGDYSPRGIAHLACLPGGNILVSAGSIGPREWHSIIHVWDVRTHESIACSFVVPNAIASLRLSPSGHIVYSDRAELYVYTLEGDLLHRINGPSVQSFVVCGNRAFYLSEPGDVASLADIPSGEVIRSVQGIWNSGVRPVCASAGDWFLVLQRTPILPAGNRREQQDGIFVLNQTDLAQVSHLRGRFTAIRTSSDGTIIAAIARYETKVNILSISNDGTLVQTHSLVTPRLCGICRGWFVSETHLYSPYHQSRDEFAVDVIDIRSGKRVRKATLSHDVVWRPNPYALASNGHELFCGFYRPARDGGSISRRYLPSPYSRDLPSIVALPL